MPTRRPPNRSPSPAEHADAPPTSPASSAAPAEAGASGRARTAGTGSSPAGPVAVGAGAGELAATPAGVGRRDGGARPGRYLPDALGEAVAQVGDRWSLLVVDALLDGPRRFGELLDEIEGLAPNILSRRLKQLDADGLVVAEPYSRRPLRHTYRLTAPGEELAGVLRLLAQWAAARRGGAPGGPAAVGLAHDACGTAVEAQWYCPTCAQVVDSARTTDLHWL